jgi:hypothetical protein
VKPKRNRRRRQTSRWIAAIRGAARAAGGLALAVAGIQGAIALSGWVASHAYFAVSAIEIRGARAASPETIVAWAGIERGASLWRVDADRATERLRHVSRLRGASVERIFPNRVAIAVEEREPVALVLTRAGSVFVDAEAHLFRPLEDESIEGFPYVTGLPPLEDERAGLASLERLRRAVRVVELWGHRAHWPSLSEIRPEETGEIVAFPEQNPMAIRFAGDVDADQFSRLGTVLALWRGREAQVAGVDLTMPGQAVLRLRGALPKPKDGRGI